MGLRRTQTLIAKNKKRRPACKSTLVHHAIPAGGHLATMIIHEQFTRDDYNHLLLVHACTCIHAQ